MKPKIGLGLTHQCGAPFYSKPKSSPISLYGIAAHSFKSRPTYQIVLNWVIMLLVAIIEWTLLVRDIIHFKNSLPWLLTLIPLQQIKHGIYIVVP